MGGGHTQGGRSRRGRRGRRARVHAGCTAGEDGAQPLPGVAVPMVAVGTRMRRRMLIVGGGRVGGVPGALERRVRGETAGAEEGGGGPGAGRGVRLRMDVT